ncbi:MAG TPA: DMT family transporter [Opitutaceae bacterium]|nr:DMT family transporter [Opitutaceae bacterium]
MTRSDETRGLLLGGLGILGFSLTLPMTRLAVAELDPVLVGLGRTLIAAALAGVVVLVRRDPFPGLRHLPALAAVSFGAIIGFPLFSSLAMRQVPAAHGAVVVGLIPLVTVGVATLRGHERPSAAFWCAAAAGSLAVVTFALVESGWVFRSADALLLVAVLLCGFGYAEGGRLSREIGSGRVLTWALILSAPVVAWPVLHILAAHGAHASVRGWAAFAYTGVISVFLAFWVWYRALAVGGVARVSQIQLLQAFITLGWASLLLGEPITRLTLITAVVVVTTVAIGRRTAVGPSPSEGLSPS